MPLEFVNQSNVSFSDLDGGCVTNVADTIVLRRIPSQRELVELFNEFEVVLRKKFFSLLSMTASEVEAKYGNLGLSGKRAEARADQLYCFLREPARDYLLNVKSAPLVAAFDDTNVRGRPRRRLSSQSMTIRERTEQKNREEQIAFVRRLIEGDLDDLLRLDQSSIIALYELSIRINNSADVFEFLEGLADEIEQFVFFSREGMTSHAKGSGRTFAPAWFGQFLASKGVWLFPQSFVGRIRYFYPRRFRPLVGWMSADESSQELFDLAAAMEKDQSKSTLCYSLSVLAMAALSSTMFETKRFCPAPFIHMKKRAAGDLDIKQNQCLSSSINAVYRMLATEFDVHLEERPDSPIFLGRKRINTSAWSGLNWCLEPTEKNTQLASSILGRPITTVPSYVQDFARELLLLLPYYHLQVTKQIQMCMSAWCIYLMQIPEEEAPKTISQIRRKAHVNGGSELDGRFSNFLVKHFEKRNVETAKRAISVMQRAWTIAAELHGFDPALTNPFDITMDTKVKDRPRSAKSKHKFVKDIVFNVIVNKNLENDYAFARSLPESWYRLRRLGSSYFDDVFSAACPLLVDIIARTGMRGKSARWLDSGEGDELVFDPHLQRQVTNTRPLARKGRQKGFVQAITIYDNGLQREVPTMFVASAKTGEYSSGYLDADLAQRFTEFVASLDQYNPIKRPVKARDTISEGSDDTEIAVVFPAFRELNVANYVTAISDHKLRAYVVKLLTECEPLVEKQLGYPFPLVRDGRALIKLHDFRVTKAVRLHDRGASREDIREALGHKSVIMADYYIKPPDERYYLANANAAALDKQIVDATKGDKDALLAYAAEQELVEGGTTSASRALRGAADHFATHKVELLNHGICTGLCSTGGPEFNGHPTPVWRPMACAECLHRASGPRFLEGLAKRVNILSWEIRESAKRSAKLNKALEHAEVNGTSVASIKNAINRELNLRKLLNEEQKQEILNIKKYEIAAGKLGKSNVVFGPASGKFGKDKVTYREVHEFELLQNLVADLEVHPALQVDYSPSIEMEWERSLSAIIRANSLEDVLYRATGDQRKKLIAIGNAVIAFSTDPTEIETLISRAFSSESYAPLNKWRTEIEQRLLGSTGEDGDA